MTFLTFLAFLFGIGFLTLFIAWFTLFVLILVYQIVARFRR